MTLVANTDTPDKLGGTMVFVYIILPVSRVRTRVRGTLWRLYYTINHGFIY